MSDLTIGIGAEISGLERGLNDADSKINVFRKKMDGLSNLGSSLSGLGSKLSLGVTAPLVGIGIMASKASSELKGVKASFDQLEDSNALLERLRESTGNLVTDLELMKKVNFANNMGLDVQKLPELFEYASRTAKQTGQDVDYLVESIVTGIGRKSPMILDNLGISAVELKSKLGGISLEMASVGDITAAVGAIAKERLEVMGRDTDTLADAYVRLKVTISNSLSTIGAILEPIFKPVIEKLIDVIRYFRDMDPTMQRVIVISGLVAAAIGPILVVIGGLIAMIPSVIAGWTAITTAVSAAGGAFTLLTGPIGLTIAALAAVVFVIVKEWDKIKPKVEAVINYFINLYNQSLEVRYAVQLIMAVFKTAFDYAKGQVKMLYEVIKSFAKSAWNIFAGLGTVIEGALTFDSNKIKQGLARILTAPATLLTDVGKDIVKGYKDIGRAAGENFMQAFSNANKGKKLDYVTLGSDSKKSTDKTKDATTSKVKPKTKTKAPDKLPDIEALKYNPLNPFTDDKALIFTPERLEKVKEEMNAASNVVAKGFLTMGDMIGEAMAGLEEKASFSGLLNNIVEQSVDLIGDLFTVLSDSLGEQFANLILGNEVSFQDMGNALLSTMAGFLSDLGKQMVKYGAAALAMSILSKKLLNPITAGPAAIGMIAAGAALVAIGGTIKGLVGGKKDSPNTSAGGGGSSNYSSSSFSNASNPNGGGTVVFRISGPDLVGVLNKQSNRDARLNSN